MGIRPLRCTHGVIELERSDVQVVLAEDVLSPQKALVAIKVMKRQCTHIGLQVRPTLSWPQPAFVLAPSRMNTA